jgi:hypothetical protein
VSGGGVIRLVEVADDVALLLLARRPDGDDEVQRADRVALRGGRGGQGGQGEDDRGDEEGQQHSGPTCISSIHKAEYSYLAGRWQTGTVLGIDSGPCVGSMRLTRKK